MRAANLLAGTLMTSSDVDSEGGGVTRDVYLSHLRGARSALDAPTRVLSRCPNSQVLGPGRACAPAVFPKGVLARARGVLPN